MIRKYLMICIILLFISSIVYANISDTWTNIQKYVGGDFDGPGTWETYELPDTDGIGRRYLKLQLVPGTTLKYKYYININSDQKWEPDFSTSSTNREIEIIDQGGGKMILEDNWADTPSTPTNLSYVSGNGQITLSWDPPEDNSKWDIIYGGGYNIYYETGPVLTNSWVKVNEDTITDTTPYTITGLMNDSSYFFTVRAYDAYFDTTGPLYSDYAEPIEAVPSLPVDVNIRFYAGNAHYDTVLIGYNLSGVWTELPLIKEGESGYWGETLPLTAGSTFSYKYIIENDTLGKRFEYADDSQRYWTFVYPDTVNISTFEIAGSFSDWNRQALTLHSDGFYRVSLNVYPGIHIYKIIINNNWILDPYNPVTRTEEDGSINSLIGIDRLTTSSELREVIIPFSDSYTITASWQDTPVVPANFRGISFSQTSTRLTWDNSQIDIEKYVIEYTESDPADEENWMDLDEVSGTKNTYFHNHIIPGSTYYYKIYAVDFAGNISEKNYTETLLTDPVNIWFRVDR